MGHLISSGTEMKNVRIDVCHEAFSNSAICAQSFITMRNPGRYIANITWTTYSADVVFSLSAIHLSLRVSVQSAWVIAVKSRMNALTNG